MGNCGILNRQRVAVRNYIAGLFIAKSAATRENSKMSPLGTLRCSIASIVCCDEVLTVAIAMALRNVDDLCVMSTI